MMRLWLELLGPPVGLEFGIEKRRKGSNLVPIGKRIEDLGPTGFTKMSCDVFCTLHGISPKGFDQFFSVSYSKLFFSKNGHMVQRRRM
mmetsp:Transcript_14489/g.25485  ORF Transcript_14489/g.25485 Transcript_14489/m.25485 type:complete len:88 (+) Transcript_14489:158-421(+)